MRSTERYAGNFVEGIIERFCSSPGHGRDPVVLRLVEQLLDNVWLRARNGSGHNEVFNAVRTVNRLPTDRLTTDAVAEVLGISRTKLNTLFLSKD